MCGAKDSDRSHVNQHIDGKGHQIAARDVVNKGDSFRPDPTKPGILLCGICDWPLSLGADECPKCGHNHLADRLATQAEERYKNEESLQKLLITVVLIFVAAIQLSSRTSLSFIEALVFSIIIAGAIWYGLICLAVRFKIWLDGRKY